MNDLKSEKSPYLLQHASNPVNWFPWGDKALAAARQANKPIFISIGYSTCHWCHVMAHESFENQHIAGLLNKDFIAIKVDREERPDIDTTYMQACQLMTGQGGWPLNLFLCPDGKPFYAFTYLPPQRSGQSPGFSEVIEKVAKIWHTQPDNLIEAGRRLSKALQEQENEVIKTQPEETIIIAALTTYQESFDSEYGGFGQAPKFPQPHNASFLLRSAARKGSKLAADMALHTLKSIANGGITDQLGGGLHRYSVDHNWLVPHFEKMLYDQALIGAAYLDAWHYTGEEFFRNACNAVLGYCLKELQHQEGGFFCGEDADSEGAEGTFYLWTIEQLASLLTAEELQVITAYYQVSPHGQFEGKNIFHRKTELQDIASDLQISLNQTTTYLNQAAKKLLDQRNKRPRPHLDDKILTGWNGLMISILARAGAAYGNEHFLKAALRAVEFVCKRLFPDGKLLRRYRDADSSISAFHEDYAFFIFGLIDLFLVTAQHKYLDLAIALQERCNQLFRSTDGGYYDSEREFISGIGRGRSKQDGAIPAAASVTAHNLIRMGRLTDNSGMEKDAEILLQQQLSHAGRYPTAFAFSLQALDLLLAEKMTLLIVIDEKEKRLSQPWQTVVNQFRPHLLTLVTAHPDELKGKLTLAEHKQAINNQTTAWLCTGSFCLDPVTEPAELEKLLCHYAPLNTFSR